MKIKLKTADSAIPEPEIIIEVAQLANGIRIKTGVYVLADFEVNDKGLVHLKRYQGVSLKGIDTNGKSAIQVVDGWLS